MKLQRVLGVVERARDVLVKNNRDLVRYLSVLAGLLLVIYFGFAFLLPLTPGRLAKPSASLITQLPLWSLISSLQFSFLSVSGAVAAALISTVIVVLALYGLALYLSWDRAPQRATVAVVIGAALMFFVISFLALPNQNTDIYNYIVRARVAAVYDSNPYYVPATHFPDDPIYDYASSDVAKITGDKFALWTLISTLIAKLVGHDPVANLLAFRLLFLLCNIANVTLIALILYRLFPRHVLAGVILYGWNPVVAVLGQSKSDTVMVTFMLLAILLLVAERRRLAVVSMGLSALIKFITLPLIAVYWLRDLRLRRWREITVNAVVLILLAAAIYAPFWEGPEIISSHAGVIIGEAGASADGMRRLLLLAFMLLVLAIGLTRDETHQSLIGGWAWVMLFFAVFIARNSFSWYLITAIGIVSLCAQRSAAALLAVISCTAFFFTVWHSTSGEGFRLPEMSLFPPYLVFLAPVLLAAIGIVVWSLTRCRSTSAMPHG